MEKRFFRISESVQSVEEIQSKTILNNLKPYKKILLVGFCFVVVFGVAILVSTFLEGVILDQKERNYMRFVQNADGLTNTFRHEVENCAKKAELTDECFRKIVEEYGIQFGSLIKLFGYEPHMQELYLYWRMDLQYWYDAQKILIQYADTEMAKIELDKIKKNRDKAMHEKLNPEFAKKVEL